MTGEAVWSVEFFLAAACCHPHPDRAYLSALAARVGDWPRFLRIVRRHRISALVWRALSTEAAMDADVLDALRRFSRRAGEASFRLAAETIRIVRLFEANNIPVVVLKGAPLACQLYGDLAVRHSRDVDLLVDSCHLDMALALLAENSYRPVPGHVDFCHVELVHDVTGISLELHWHLTENRWQLPVLPSPQAWEKMDIGGGGSVPVLPDDFSLLYLFVHGARHCWFRLKWLADIAFLVEQLPPERMAGVILAAESHGLWRPVTQGLVLAHRLMKVPLPPAVAGMEGDRGVRILLRMAEEALAEEASEGQAHGFRTNLTRANLSHYLLGRGWCYVLAELRDDLFRPVYTDRGKRPWYWRLPCAVTRSVLYAIRCARSRSR
ncbi:nucleotidyltransferase domain-containing protein [Magnetospirillum molischianum]|uniref:Nucleotidyltransferase family protein n=1 Tax=Magnetospirillum molischianum DSM 120 TaxID=1150626 RepID=H8FSQ0_MAGML|nr:nucleotidyltransferase family protein [Magnetospirillum molischianum]CCG41388.1 hypothetical protein PHAMO_270229 [Magnetospirillum molischianum DSM 120]